MQSIKNWYSLEGNLEPRWLAYIGVLSLILYSFMQFLIPETQGAVEKVLVITGLIAFCLYGKGIRKAPLLLLIGFLCLQLFSWTLGLWQYPQWAIDDPRLQDLSRLFIFICVAWWLKGSTRNTLIVWGLAVAGILLTTLIAPDDDGWLTGFTGERVGFGIRNNQHASMLFGVSLLGLLCFARRFWSEGRARYWRIAFWCLAMAMVVAGIAVGQTRAVWLSATVAGCIGLVLWIIRAVMNGNTRYLAKYLITFTVAMVVVSGVLVSTLGDSLNKRFHKESSVVSQLMDGEITEVPYTSIGIRINSWIAASEWISERPMTGWGPEGRQLVMSETTWLPDWVLAKYGHLHNYFLETWVEYGIVGLIAISLLAIWIGRATWLAWRANAMPDDIACFGLMFFIYWMIISNFESYNSFPTGLFVHNLVVGGLITHYWRWRLSLQSA